MHYNSRKLPNLFYRGGRPTTVTAAPFQTTNTGCGDRVDRPDLVTGEMRAIRIWSLDRVS